MRTVLIAIAMSALVAGCGVGAEEEPAPASASSSVAASEVAPPPSTKVERPKGKFPAASVPDIVALANRRPTGVVTYDFQVSGAPGSTVELASDDVRGRVHRSTPGEQDVWVGFQVQGGIVTFVCVAAPASPPDCKDGDPEELGVRTIADVGAAIGNDAVQRIFGVLEGNEQIAFGQDSQIGLEVSCMAGVLESGDHRLCVSARGVITQLTAPGVNVHATETETKLPAAILDKPTASDAPPLPETPSTGDGETSSDASSDSATTDEGSSESVPTVTEVQTVTVTG